MAFEKIEAFKENAVWTLNLKQVLAAQPQMILRE